MTALPPEDVVLGAPWITFTAWLDHAQPRSVHEAAPCAGCLAGADPTEGCEEGQRLWGLYRLAVVEGRSTPVAS